MRFIDSKKTTRKDLEAAFEKALRLFGADLPTPKRQVRLNAPESNHAWDFVWVEFGVAVEIQGGIFKKGRTGHSSVSGLVRDQMKSNMATALGYRTLFFNAKDLDTFTAARRTADWCRAALRVKPGSLIKPKE